MANYNYGGGSFSGFSTSPWIQAMQQIAPQFQQFQQGMYNSDPNLAMTSFLDTIRTSNTNEDMMRRMLPMIQKRWIEQQMKDAQGGFGQLRPFSSMLGSTNWDRELARYAPNYRNESPSMFNRPVRTVTF